MLNGKITMELSVEEWNTVINALAQRPYAEVVSIINQLKKQGDAAVGNTEVAEKV